MSSRDLRDERGAVMVLTAMFVPVVLVIGALAVGTTSLWTVRQDLQRAVDLGALAAAANAPTVNPGGNLVDLPFGLDGELPTTDDLGLSDASGWFNLGCSVARAQLAPGRSAVTRAVSDIGPDDVECGRGWEWEDPLLRALAGCAADLLGVSGCSQRLSDELRALSPAVDAVLGEQLDDTVQELAAAERMADEVVEDLRALRDTLLGDANAQVAAVAAEIDRLVDELAALEAQREQLLGEIGGLTAELGGLPLVGSAVRRLELEGQIAALEAELASVEAQIAETEAAIGGLVDQFADLESHAAGLAGVLDAVIARMEEELFTDGALQVRVRLANLLPALLTPRARVTIDDLDARPTFSPFTFSMSAEAVARRTIKSAMVLPTLGIPVGSAARRLGLPVGAAERLGVEVPGGYVLDPNEHLDGLVPRALDRSAALVDALQDRLGSRIGDALARACGGFEVDCPAIPGIVDSQRVFGAFRQDLLDATRRPNGTPPRLDQLVGETVWAVTALRPVDVEAILGGDLFEEAISLPVLGDVLPDLTFIPALDVVPVVVGHDPETGLYTLQPVDLGDVAATKGLYQARLVR